jgi:diacylglycerol kinase
MNISNTKQQISLLKQSFGYAFAGLKASCISEINFRIHVIIALYVLCLGIVFKLNNYEWIAIILCIGMVIAFEIFNTVIEHLCDFVSIDIRPEIKVIKDMSAAAVLLVAAMSVLIACIIFLPKIYQNIFLP